MFDLKYFSLFYLNKITKNEINDYGITLENN